VNKNIDEVEFTVFDTETTGLEPQSGDRIVEIAAIRFKGNERIATFESLLNPHRPISEGAFQVNKITPDMLKDAPGIELILPKFLDFIKDTCLCSYNAEFDLEFLNNELKLLGKNLAGDIMVIDILRMAKRLLPGLERYALWFVAENLGIKTQQMHRALPDTELTFKVFNRLKEILKLKGILDFVHLLNIFSINAQVLENLNVQKIAQIQEAINLGVRLKIKYISSSGMEVSEREVLPREIRQENNRSYLIGFCCLRREERTFRVDGILHLEIV
jgi:DNA polymerase-3 subunit alpha (Gram-positive type)